MSNQKEFNKVEFGETVLNEIYNFMMATISAGIALAPEVIGKRIVVTRGGLDTYKDFATTSDESHYAQVGRGVGNALNLVLALEAAKVALGLSLPGQATAAFTTSEIISHIGLGNKFASLFDTYVRRADQFYSAIEDDPLYAKAIWDGLVDKQKGSGDALCVFRRKHYF